MHKYKSWFFCIPPATLSTIVGFFRGARCSCELQLRLFGNCLLFKLVYSKGTNSRFNCTKAVWIKIHQWERRSNLLQIKQLGRKTFFTIWLKFWNKKVMISTLLRRCEFLVFHESVLRVATQFKEETPLFSQLKPSCLSKNDVCLSVLKQPKMDFA